MTRNGAPPREMEPLLRGADEGSATRRDLVRVLFKRRWTILVSILIVTAIAVAGVMSLPPTYEAQAKVFVQVERQMTPTFFSGLASASDRQDIEPVSRRLENEMALIAPTPTASQVVEELGLSWADIYHPPLTHLLEPLLARAEPLLASAFGVSREPPSQAETVEAFQASISVNPAESRTAETTSNVIVVSLRSPDARLAQEALQRVLNIYLGFDKQLTDTEALKAYRLVTEASAAANQELRTVEREVQSFLKNTRFDPRNPDREKVAGQQTVTSPRDDQTSTALKATIVGLESQLNEVRQIYTPTSEPVRRLERSLDDARQRLSTEITVDATNYSRYDQLDRELRSAETRADELQRRRDQIALFLQINRQSSSSRMVLEAPQRPEVSDWKARGATVVLGTFMGLVLGLVLAGLGEYADNSIGSREDVRRHLGAQVLATIPTVSRRARRAMFASAAAPVRRRRTRHQTLARASEALTSRLTAGVTRHDPSGLSILVTSAHHGEGKTFTSALLAAELVRLRLGKVLLVDVGDDGRPPMLEGGVPYDRRLDEARAVEAGGERGTETTSLTLLSLGRQQGAGELGASKLAAFLERERARFDWIVFDGRCAEGHGMTALAREVDGVLLVVEADITRQQVARHAIDVLELERPDKLAVVLNRKRFYVPRFLYDRL